MNNSRDFAWRVEHRQQTGMRPFRMPDLLGALLCVAGLPAIPGNAFSQVPQGVFHVRPTRMSLRL